MASAQEASCGVTDNRAVAPSGYDPYQITPPSDPRLPGGGGYVIGDLYDIWPALFGRTDNYITGIESFGKAQNYWHGVDAQVNARLGNGLTVQGGTSTGRAVTDRCDVISDNPQPPQLPRGATVSHRPAGPGRLHYPRWWTCR